MTPILLPWDRRPAQPLQGPLAPRILISALAGVERASIGNFEFTRSGTITPRATPFGVGVSSSGGSDEILAPTGTEIVAAAGLNSFSVLFACQLNATGQTNRYLARNGISAHQRAIIYGYAANQFEFFSEGHSGTNPRTGSGITVSDTLPHVIAYTYDGATWAGWLDGQNIFSVSRTFTLTAVTGGPAAILSASAAGYINATFLLSAAWDRGLSPKEASELTANPWQLFQPRRIFVPMSAPSSVSSAAAAVAGESGAFAATASSPATATLATTGNSGTFAASASTETSVSLAATGDSGTFSGLASTVATATLAVTGDTGTFSGSAFSIGSAFLASLGDSGIFSGSASVAAAATIGRPASDTSNSGWTASTGSDLYAMLDEVTPDAADYIVATSVGAVCELTLNTTAYPGTASQVLKFRASSSTGNSVIVRLRNTGGATVRSQTQLLTAADTEYSIGLTAGEIAAITSGALSVQLESA